MSPSKKVKPQPMNEFRHQVTGLADQPVSSIEWVHRDTLHANAYNPNKVAPPELRLLKVSILASGWTQPIVVREDDEIVDGYHRWTVSADKDVYALTDGYVPVVRLRGIPMAEQMMATIRHNRARGVHTVAPMADIVGALINEHGMTSEEIEERLQMEDEEVDRLYDRSGMPNRAQAEEFNKGWTPE